jgi:opacity protein-like surface antigen
MPGKGIVLKEASIVYRRLAVLTAVVAVAGSPAWAQDKRIELGVFGGYTLSDGVTGDSVRAPDGRLYNSIEPKDSASFGLDLGFFVNENTQVGALFSHQASKMVLGGGVERELGDFAVQNYHGTFTYHWGDSDAKIRPYLMGGLGATHYGGVEFTSVAGQPRTIDGQTKFSTTWGMGVKMYPSPSFGIKIGARWTPTYIKSDSAGWWCDPYWGCYVVGDAQYSNQFEFTGGFSFRF